MGWNTGGLMLENLVIGLYDLGKLDKKALKLLLEEFSGKDADTGDAGQNLTKDGKNFYQVVIETWGLKMPKRTKAEQQEGSDAYYAYDDKVYDRFYTVMSKYR